MIYEHLFKEYWFRFQDAQLEFKGQRIWSAAMEDLMSRGMHNANQVLCLPHHKFCIFLPTLHSGWLESGGVIFFPLIFIILAIIWIHSISGSSLRLFCWGSGFYLTLWRVQMFISYKYESEVPEWCWIIPGCVNTKTLIVWLYLVEFLFVYPPKIGC